MQVLDSASVGRGRVTFKQGPEQSRRIGAKSWVGKKKIVGRTTTMSTCTEEQGDMVGTLCNQGQLTSVLPTWITAHTLDPPAGRSPELWVRWV